MKVIILPEALEYLDEMAFVLFEKQYFSYLETSKRYVDDLIDDIEKKLPTRLHRPAPQYYDKYGKDLYYAVFKKNRRTSYYAFFSKYNDNGQTVYLVCYIGNNHTDAQHI